MKQLFFPYTQAQTDYLKQKDKRLGAIIDRVGHIDRPIIPDLYTALLHSIVGQQISTKAHATVWARVEGRFSPITPEHIAKVSDEELQQCGMTMRKVGYIKQITDEILSGRLELAALDWMEDEEVCKTLVKLPGIGMWTAEMLMTFSMLRPNILSYGDLAIRRGMRMVYRHRELTPALFEKYKKRLSPQCTVAALYFWAVAGGKLPELTDPGK